MPPHRLSAVPKRGSLKSARKWQENATFLQRSFFNVAVQFFACCSAAFGKKDVRTAEKRMLRCNFWSAAFRNCSAISVFACGMLRGWGLEGWGLGRTEFGIFSCFLGRSKPIFFSVYPLWGWKLETCSLAGSPPASLFRTLSCRTPHAVTEHRSLRLCN